MKKTISVFLCLVLFLLTFGTNIPTISAAGNALEVPGQVDGNTLNINITAPANIYKGVFYIDGIKTADFSAASSGSTISKDIDISGIKSGRHIVSFIANTDSGLISEEKTFNIAKSGVPTFSAVAYLSGDSEISESEWEEGKPAPTTDGYKFTLSEDFSGDVKLYYYENEKKILLDASVTKENNVVTLKTARVPFGNTLYVAEFGDSLQYVFKTVPSDNVTIYKNFDFEKELGFTYYSDVVDPAKGEIIERKDVEGNGVLHMSTTSSGDTMFAQTDVGTIVNEDKYVVDFKINITKMDSGSVIRILDGKDSAEAVRYGFIINSSGKIEQASDETPWYKSKLSYTISKNKWYRIVVAYNLTSDTYNFYVYDGNSCVYKKENYDISGALRPTYFKIDFPYSNYAVDFMIDDFRVYSGNTKKDSLEADNSGTIMEKASDAEKIIGTASVFTIGSDNYYFANSKHKYQSAAEKPLEIDGAAYVSGEFVSNVLLAQDTVYSDKIKVGSTVFESGSDGIKNVNGKLYLRADKAASALGKQYTYDDRGYFVFSSGTFSAINSGDLVSIFDSADVFYRYVAMDNPRGEEVIADFKNNGLYGVHPRILFTSEEIAWFKNLAENGDAEAQNEITNAKKRAEDYLYWSKLTANDSDSVKQSTASSGQNIITYLAEAYLLTGDSRYAEAGIKILDAASSWTNLAWGTSNLITGHWAALMAIGYDSFYNYLNATSTGQAKLQTYRDAIAKLAFADTIMAYSGGNGPRWITIADNFSGVIGGGMLALCMAVADEAQFKDEVPYLLENILKTNELSAALYYNDGAYFEGVTYSEYMLENLTIGLEALFKACGSDYGISNSSGFTKAGDMFAYLNTASQSFDFSDCEPQSTNSFVPLWFGYRYGETGAAELNMKRMRENGIDNEVLRSMFFYKKMVAEYGEINTQNMPLDKYFSKTLTGSFRNSFDDKYPIAAFYHLAKNGTTHDHLDAGQWEFEANGIKWATDLGPDDYNLPGYFSNEGYKIYRKSPQGHNLVLINPLKNSNTYYGQSLDGESSLLAYSSEESEASAKFSLKNVYSRDVSEYTREFVLGDSRTTFTVNDEISLLSSGSEVYWFMHTEADINIVNNNTVVLSKDGYNLRVDIDCSASNYEVLDMAAEPLSGTPTVSGQATETVRKLAIHIPSASKNESISVKLIPNEFLSKTTYHDEDVIISVVSPSEVPTVTFDGNIVALDSSKAPMYTAIVPFADKALGYHDVVVKIANQEYKRTVEFCSNLATDRFSAKYIPSEGQKLCLYQNGGYYDGRSMNQGTLTQIAGKDGVVDDYAFRMTKTGGDAYVQINGEYADGDNAAGDTLYSIAFDVRRGNEPAIFDLESKCTNVGTAYIGRAENLITESGSIDNSNVVIPANEWHNFEIVWETEDKGNYWIYLDKELVYSGVSNYNLSSLYLIKFQLKKGSMDFDNVSYGKYIASPRVNSVAYFANGKEYEAGDGVVSAGSEKIILNLSGEFSAVNGVKVNGTPAANVQLDGKKLIVTPATDLPANSEVNIVVATAEISGISINKGVVYRVKTGDVTFKIASPIDNATYFDKDVVISVLSETAVPEVTFDGTAVTLDGSKAPIYTATVPFAGKTLGHHKVVVKNDGQEYTRTIEFCSNVAADRFTYKFGNSQQFYIYRNGGYWDGRALNQGTLTQIAGTDGVADGTAFTMTKTGGDAYTNIGYNQSELPESGYLYSVAFDVRRGNSVGVFDLEAKNSGSTVWIAKPEELISESGLIDNSGVILPANEWHNVEIVWELANKGKYWVYYDKALIHTGDSNYDLSNLTLIKFQVKKGTLDFDNVSYGKYIVNPRVESVAYIVKGQEFSADDGYISSGSEKIILNLNDAYSAVNSAKVNGILAAEVQVDGNKLIITPASALPVNSDVNIEITSASVSGMTLNKSVVYKVATKDTGLIVNYPADNAKYYNKDIVISVVSPMGVPVVTFDGEALSLDSSNAPEYTVSVPFGSKSLGLHDIVIKTETEEYTRTIELISNIATDRFTYKYLPGEGQKFCIYRNGEYWDGRSINNGMLTQIAGTDGLTDGTAFTMTKTSGDAYVNIGYNQSELPESGYLYSVAFDVRRGNSTGVFDLEAKTSSGSTIWIAKPEELISRDGEIDNSKVILPANEWHNVEIVWELTNKGKYWIYYDNELIYTGDSNYDLSNIGLIKFQVKEGTLDFDNVSYGKFIMNPNATSASYVANGVETSAIDNVISPFASSITLNLTDSFATGSISAENIKINGVAVASASVNGNKLTVVPTATFGENAVVNIEVSIPKISKSISYKLLTGPIKGKLISFTLKEDQDGKVYAELDYNGGFSSGEEKLMIVIGAFYGPNRCVNGKAVYVPIKTGDNKINSEAITVPEGAIAKAFLWETDMSPVSSLIATAGE